MTKCNLTANSKFTYQGKEFIPGDKVPFTNREEALKLLNTGFVVGTIPQENPTTTLQRSKNASKKEK